jgi:hypothetical protein
MATVSHFRKVKTGQAAEMRDGTSLSTIYYNLLQILLIKLLVYKVMEFI